jgi:flavin reductase (DIM6/NTAB) family NADH-FMN oxidoreductase RutF
VGSVSGRDFDKFARYNITTRPGPVLGMPLLEAGCSAWLECRLLPEPHTEDAYDTCFAEVVAAAADPRIFANGRWSFSSNNDALHTIHHLGGGNFVRSGNGVQAKAISEA